MVRSSISPSCFWIVVAIGLNGALNNAASAAILDQDNLYGTCCQVDVIDPDLLQQTVTAGRSGLLGGIIVEMHQPYGNGVVTFSLYEGTATPSSTPIFTQDIDTTQFPSSGHEFLWDVSSLNYGLNAGDEFTFGLTGLGAGNGASFADDIDGQYLGGSLFLNGELFEPPRDLAFRTWVNPDPSLPPWPEFPVDDRVPTGECPGCIGVPLPGGGIITAVEDILIPEFGLPDVGHIESSPSVLHPAGLFDDVSLFLDRSGRQRADDVPTELEGADYVETSQNNADWMTANGASIDIAIDVIKGGVIYLFIDTPEINNNRGSVPFYWMNDPDEWDGNVFFDTGSSLWPQGTMGWWNPGPADRQFYIYGVGPLDGGTYHIREQDVDASWLGIAALFVPEPGDANLDGEFNSADMVQVFVAGEYETGQEAGWDEGDWNGDRIFDSSDMVLAFVDGGYEQGPRTDVAAVPEPGGWILLVIGLALWLFGRRGMFPACKACCRFAERRLAVKKKVLSLSFLAWFICPLIVADAATIRETTVIDGIQRRYTLHVPDSYEGNEAWPLVVNMHCATCTASEQMFLTGMNSVADVNQFLVVYPQALGQPPMWNDRDWNGGVDDVGFIAALIDELESDYRIDPSRIYATGMSQGSAMSYALAAELSDRIAAIAPVAGQNGYNPPSARPLPVLLIHGTADSLFGGAYIPPPIDVTVPPVADVVSAWRESNRCEDTPVVTAIADTDLEDESTVTRNDYLSCASYVTTSEETIDAEVIYYEIENGGHTWPGGPNHGTGSLNRDINASQVIWEFFSRHEVPLLLAGDFNGDGTLNANDIDLLGQETRIELKRRVFDVNQDGTVDANDYATWVTRLSHTWFGDANLDLEFNSGDMVQVFAVGKYETAEHAGWAEGDWNGDGIFDSSDMVTAFADGGYEKGLRTDVAAVPEPHTGWLLLSGSLPWLFGRRVRRPV